MTGPRGGVIGVKREQAIAVDAHADADALRDLRGGPVAQRACSSAASQPLRADSIEQVLLPARRRSPRIGVAPESATSTSGKNHTM